MYYFREPIFSLTGATLSPRMNRFSDIMFENRVMLKTIIAFLGAMLQWILPRHIKNKINNFYISDFFGRFPVCHIAVKSIYTSTTGVLRYIRTTTERTLNPTD